MGVGQTCPCVGRRASVPARVYVSHYSSVKRDTYTYVIRDARAELEAAGVVRQLSLTGKFSVDLIG